MKPFLHRKLTSKFGEVPPLEPQSKTFGRLLGYVLHYRLAIALTILLLLLGTVLNLTVPYLLGEGLNNLSCTNGQNRPLLCVLRAHICLASFG
jgi:hypothetical protein